MLDLHREKFKKIEKIIGKIFSILPFSPNQYTILSLVFAFGNFYFLLRQKLILAILSFSLAGFLDFVDGAVARYKNQNTKIGAYLDTIIDRYVEALLILGMFFLPLPKIFMPPSFWLFLFLFGSMITTYAKAAAKEKNLVSDELKGGILSKGERVFLILIALLLGIIDPRFILTTYLLIALAVLANITALQRIRLAMKNK